jgi:hypothetical protein
MSTALLGLSSSVLAVVPDPGLCIVPNVVVNPGGNLDYVVTVRDAFNAPCAFIMVELFFSPTADFLLCWCVGQDHPVIRQVTDAAGRATFRIAAGGCLDPSALGPQVNVVAAGTFLASVGVVSPDAVDNAGLLPWQGWNPGAKCAVGLSDAAFHSAPLAVGRFTFCTDMNSDGVCNLGDAVILTGPIRRGDNCPH